MNISSPEKCLPVTLVIFGATGDLTWRKLIPALYGNYKKGRLPDCPFVVGFARRPWTDEEFRNKLRDEWRLFWRRRSIPRCGKSFLSGCIISKANWIRPNRSWIWTNILRKLETGPADRLYYLATAPEFFIPIVGFPGARGDGRPGGRLAPAGDRKAVRKRPELGAGSQPRDP